MLQRPQASQHPRRKRASSIGSLFFKCLCTVSRAVREAAVRRYLVVRACSRARRLAKALAAMQLPHHCIAPTERIVRFATDRIATPLLRKNPNFQVSICLIRTRSNAEDIGIRIAIIHSNFVRGKRPSSIADLIEDVSRAGAEQRVSRIPACDEAVFTS